MDKEIPHFILRIYFFFYFTIHRIGELAPGILYMEDFLVIDKLNAMRQVTLRVYSTVHRIVHMFLEFPKVV